MSGTTTLQSTMYRLWETACIDAPQRPSAQVIAGHFVLRITGNRANWGSMVQAAGVPSNAVQTIDGDTLTCRWPSLADAIFGDGGMLAQHFGAGYEVRQAQLHMARMVQRAIEMNAPAVIEAGTGTGKSFAYAAICMAAGKKLVISTSNKNLQMQLVGKDLPFLAKLFPGKTFALAQGKQNYACRVKCETLGDVTIADPALRQWYATTDTGNVEEIPFAADYKAVAAMTADDECTGGHCLHYHNCFYYAARERMKQADVIVTNHKLLCLDAIAAGNILPPADVTVVDEAHKLADYARGTIGVEFTMPQVHKAIALAQGHAAADELLAAEQSAQLFDWQVSDYLRDKDGNEVAVSKDHVFVTGMQLVTALTTLAARLWIDGEGPANADETKRAARAARLRTMAGNVATISQPTSTGFVRWLKPGRGADPLTMCAQPFNVSATIISMTKGATIFCSATIAAPDMGHFLRLAGLPDALQMTAASPFDYESNALLYAPSGTAPAPNSPHWPAWCIDEMRQLVLASGGGAFLLFTSYTAMNNAAAALRRTFADRRLTVFVQGELPKLEIARRFREDGNAVLFATKSFFEGVSIDGDALRLVVIDKLPFAAPSPLTTAMEADAASRGLDGFKAVRLPNMIIELKQGTGRLIRTSTDIGVIAILDSRVNGTPYGRTLVLPALPPAQRTSHLEHVEAFFARRRKAPTLTLAQVASNAAAQVRTTLERIDPAIVADFSIAAVDDLPF